MMGKKKKHRYQPDVKSGKIQPFLVGQGRTCPGEKEREPGHTPLMAGGRENKGN